jgi:hypothetical protein
MSPRSFAVRRGRIGDTEGDTYGDSVSPSCISHPWRKFQRKYRAAADCSASRINPDLPSGPNPGRPSFHLSAGFIFQRGKLQLFPSASQTIYALPPGGDIAYPGDWSNRIIFDDQLIVAVLSAVISKRGPNTKPREETCSRAPS